MDKDVPTKRIREGLNKALSIPNCPVEIIHLLERELTKRLMTASLASSPRRGQPHSVRA